VPFPGISQDEKQVMVIAGERHSLPTTSSRGRRPSTVRKGLESNSRLYLARAFLVVTTNSISRRRWLLPAQLHGRSDEWTNRFKVAGDRPPRGRWRAVYNTRPDETDEEAFVRRFSSCPPSALLLLRMRTGCI